MDRKTQELVNKRLALSGIRDLEFPTLQGIDGTEAIPVVHNGHNKLLNIDTILKEVTDNIPNIFIAEDVLSFKDALSKIPIKKRVQGLVVTYKVGGYYYTKRYVGESSETSEFIKNQNWIPVSAETSNFKGVFLTKQDLQTKSIYPKIGDIAFVGDKISNSIQYKFTSSGWVAEESLDDNAKKVEVIYSRPTDSKVISTGRIPIQDSAYKDHLGRNIVETYVTKCDLITQLKQIISSTEGININFIDNNNSCNSNLEEVMFKKLFERLKGLFSNPLSLQDIGDNLAIRGNVLYFQGKEIGRFEDTTIPSLPQLTPHIEKRVNNSNVEIRVGIGDTWSDWTILSPSSTNNPSTDNTPSEETEFTATYSFARNDNNAIKAEIRRIGKNRVSIIITPSEGIDLSDYNIGVVYEEGARVMDYSDIQLTKNTKFMIYALYQKGDKPSPQPSPNPGENDTTGVNVSVEYTGDIPLKFEIINNRNVNSPGVMNEVRELGVPRGSRVTLKYQDASPNHTATLEKEYFALLSINDSKEIRKDYHGDFNAFEDIQVDIDTVFKLTLVEKPKVDITIDKNPNATPILRVKHSRYEPLNNNTFTLSDKTGSFEAYVGDILEVNYSLTPTAGYLVINDSNSKRVFTYASGRQKEEFVAAKPLSFISKLWHSETIPVSLSINLQSNGDAGTEGSISLVVDRKDKINERIVSIGKEYITLDKNSKRILFNKYDVIESITANVTYAEDVTRILSEVSLLGISEQGGVLRIPVGRISSPNVTWDTRNYRNEFTVIFNFAESASEEEEVVEDEGDSSDNSASGIANVGISFETKDYYFEHPEDVELEITYSQGNTRKTMEIGRHMTYAIPHGSKIESVRLSQGVTVTFINSDEAVLKVLNDNHEEGTYKLMEPFSPPFLLDSNTSLILEYPEPSF